MEMPTNRRSDQIQALGDILHLVEQLDIEDIATVTSGSRLGRVVDLLAQVQQTLALNSANSAGGQRGNSIATTDRRKHNKHNKHKTNGTNGVAKSGATAKNGIANHNLALVNASEADAISQENQNGNLTATQQRQPNKSSSSTAKSPPQKAVAAKSHKKAKQTKRKQSKTKGTNARTRRVDPKRIMISYLKQVFADPEVFPDRHSITSFFERHFQIEFQIDKESRPELVSRLSRLAIAQQVSRNELGDLLLADTNQKYGDFLKQDEATFRQGWRS
ncbi:hypothetical protein Pse7367_1564 [Thalassoporum mexicanum PCC 7367]|uniref:hypothetical protein n=1 Tax=Thalassoporum mexicanum TaxID=3457544 RepID=UPI00029F9A5E|nr:hypothetical protein [Pseudanabaena sp. PCC 7367]AFY69853.1 hypothetical protein Pse7367_1564 [Pseudanabaena sp. PCC 7367]